MDLVKKENLGAPLEGLSRLPIVRQLGLMIGLAASIAIGVAVVLWSQEPTYRVLYGGLSDKDSAAVVQALQQHHIDYKIDEATGGLMVPAGQVHDARLALASEGLPKGTGMGFEILDQEQRFGTSQFMENARYQRALEGELARTIMSINTVRSARVHLALPHDSVFVRERKRRRASVLVDLYPGRVLETGQVAAIVHLVASSIPNLEPADVTVVDQGGHLLTAADSNGAMALSGEQFDYARRVENTYVHRIENILAPIVGPAGVRAQVSAQLDFTSGEQTQESYDPQHSAIRSEQRSEEQTRTGEVGGVPGSLSNEPPGQAKLAGGAAAATPTGGAARTAAAEEGPLRKRSRSTVNYELDRTISHTRRQPGAVRRLSVAVVVDDKPGTDKGGKPTRLPRSPAELARITALVKQAVGFSADRGDSVEVLSASFLAPEVATPLPEPPLWKRPWVWDLGKQVLGGLVVLFILLGVLRPIMRALAVKPVRMQPAGGAPDALAEDQLSLGGGEPQRRLPSPGSYDNDLAFARNLVGEDSKRAAQVVKNWVGEE